MNEKDQKHLDAVIKFANKNMVSVKEHNERVETLQELLRLANEEISFKVYGISIKELERIITEQSMKNPYPIEVFEGKTEEGRIGKFACKVWNDCLDDLLDAVKKAVEEKDE